MMKKAIKGDRISGLKTNLHNELDCRKFTGYKPCEPGLHCPCDHPEPYGQRILIVNLDYIGDVLMTTSMLPAIKRKYPVSTVHWVTLKNAIPVLENNRYLFRIWEWNDETRMILGQMRFEEVLNADKNVNSAAFVLTCKADSKLGFGLNGNGAIVPLNTEAEYNYRMGLDDDLKFRKNTRTGPDILAETWKLDYARDEYVLDLTREEKQFSLAFRERLGIREKDFVIGINTGCSGLYPLKKMTGTQHIRLIRKLRERMPDAHILLLGGKEDTERNREIREKAGEWVQETPATEGLRRGILYAETCDVIVSGDTLGMHLGIGLKKNVIAWFGLSCSAEIDLFGRGEKIISEQACSPCWKKHCDKPICLENLDLDAILSAIERTRKRMGNMGK